MENLTFNELPQAIIQLYQKLDNIEKVLLQRHNDPQPETDELLTVQDTAKFLSLSVPTVYGLISKRELPVMKRSKRCYFSKVELIDYLKQGRIRTFAEAEKEADNHINRRVR